MQLYAGYQEFKAWLGADKKLEQRRAACAGDRKTFSILYSAAAEMSKGFGTKSKATEPYYIGK